MSAIWQLRDELEEDLNGLRICDYITRDDIDEYLDDFDKWSKTAQPGDTYYAQDFSYTYEPEYSASVWLSDTVGVGEEIVIRKTFNYTDLDDVKTAVMNCVIEKGGIGEIYDNDEEETYLSYDGNTWTVHNEKHDSE